MTHHLLTHGFIVVGANVASTDFNAPTEHDLKAARVINVLDWALTQSPVLRKSMSSIGAMGHSAGGKLSFCAASVRVGLGDVGCKMWVTVLGHDERSCNDFRIYL